MTTIFMGGMPTSVDVRKLRDAFGAPAVGALITHESIEQALGIARTSRRYWTVTNAWRKAMLADHNIELGTERGDGYKVLNNDERISAGMHGVRCGARKMVRSVKRSEHVRTEDPHLLKKQELMRKLGAAVVFEVNNMAKAIEPPKPQQQAPRLVRSA